MQARVSATISCGTSSGANCWWCCWTWRGAVAPSRRVIYQQLLDELKLYNPEILKKKRIVVANKMDLPEAKKNLAAFKRNAGRTSRPSKKKQAGKTRSAGSGRAPAAVKLIEISALDGKGL